MQYTAGMMAYTDILRVSSIEQVSLEKGKERYNDLQGLSLPSSMLLNAACLMSQGLSYVNVGRHSFYL